jgi:IS5 family transposase
VTSESVHDATQFKLLLGEWAGKGEPLLADRAYDAASNFEFAKEKGFRPIIHPRSFELHGFARREMAIEFELGKDFYRLRSVTEGFFGGLANRYLSRTRCRSFPRPFPPSCSWWLPTI